MNWLSFYSSEVCGRLCETLIHSLWQVAGLSALAWTVARLWRGISVEWNYSIHVTALLLSCVSVPFTFWLSATTEAPAVVAVRPSVSSELEEGSRLPDIAVNRSSTTATQDHVSDSTMPAEATVPVRTEPAIRFTGAGLWDRVAPWLAGAYAAGVLWMLLRIAVSVTKAERLRARSRPIFEGEFAAVLRRLAQAWSLRATPALATAEHIVVPKVVGLLKPTILLPTAALAGLTSVEVEMILAHELAHVRRYDLWLNLVQRLAEAVLFFNPALWLLSRRISTLREYCCDEMACGTIDEPTHQTHLRYAQALLRTVELSRSVSANQVGLTALAASGRSPSELRRRVARLFGEPVREPLPISRGGAIAGVCVLMLIFFGPTIRTAAVTALGEQAATDGAKVVLQGSFSEQASAILGDLLRVHRQPFHGDADIQRIMTDFGRHIGDQCRAHGIDIDSISAARRSAILTRLRDRGAQLLELGEVPPGEGFDRRLNRRYLNFPDKLDTLQWKVVMALERGDLTEEQVALQAKRLSFLEQQVLCAPETKYTKRSIMLEVVRDWFDDPLQTPIDQPLSPEAMAEFERRLGQFITGETKEATDDAHFGAAFSAAMSRMIRFSADELWDLASPENTLPLFGQEIVGHGIDGTQFSLSFRHNRHHSGDTRSLRLVEEGSFIFNVATGEPVGYTVPRSVPALQTWATDHQQGDLAFCREGLIGLRGARLLRLDVSNWLSADRVGANQLRSMVEKQGVPMLSVAGDHARYEQTGGAGYAGFYFAILTAEGKLAVAHVSDFSGPKDLSIRVRPRNATLGSDSPQLDDTSSVTISGNIVMEDGSPATTEGQMYYQVEYPNGNGAAGTDERYVDKFAVRLAPGIAFLTYYVDGFAPVWTEQMRVSPGEPRNDIRLVLNPGTTVPVRVTDEEGSPVAGATVIAHPEIHGLCQGPIYRQTTDADGELLLQHLASTNYQLKITAPGFQPLRTTPLRVAEGETLRLTMVRSSPAEGIIRFADGTPAPVTKLRVIKEWTRDGKTIGFENEGDGFWGKVLATTDARGRFRIDQLTDGSQYVFVVEAVDGVRAIIDDLQAGTENWQLVLPRRKDLVIYVKGDLTELPQHRGKVLASVRQPFTITRPDGSTYGELIGEDVPLDPAEGGGWAIFRGLAVDLRDQAPQQQVRVSLNRRSSGEPVTKTVALSSQPGTVVRLELPDAEPDKVSPLAADHHRLKVLVARGLTKTNDISVASALLPERFVEWTPASGATQCLVVESRPPLFTEQDVETAVVQPSENVSGGPRVLITLDAVAGERVKRETSQLLKGDPDPNLRLLTLIDGQVITSPRLVSVIGQKLELTGNLDARVVKSIIESVSSTRDADGEDQRSPGLNSGD